MLSSVHTDGRVCHEMAIFYPKGWKTVCDQVLFSVHTDGRMAGENAIFSLYGLRVYALFSAAET